MDYLRELAKEISERRRANGELLPDPNASTPAIFEVMLSAPDEAVETGGLSLPDRRSGERIGRDDGLGKLKTELARVDEVIREYDESVGTCREALTAWIEHRGHEHPALSAAAEAALASNDIERMGKVLFRINEEIRDSK
jgi:hypothetical protein